MGRGNRGRIQKPRPQQNGYYIKKQSSNQQLPQVSGDRQRSANSQEGNGGRGGFNNQGRRGINDRGRGLRIRGRGRGSFNPQVILHHIEQKDCDELAKIVVNGLLESDVANERDNGLATCRDWLEERARYGSKKPIEYVYLKSVS